jgi:hypothetical protein
LTKLYGVVAAGVAGFSLAIGAAAYADCDSHGVSTLQKQIEIADFKPGATPPPANVLSDLLRRTAALLVTCAASSRHVMGSSIGDYLQAAVYAKRSGQAYLQSGDRVRACQMFALAAKSQVAASSQAARATSWDNAYLKGFSSNARDVKGLIQIHCRS